MKWILIALIAAMAAGFVYLQRNSVKTSYVNGLALYTAIPGKEYLFEKDCYVFKLTQRNTSWPLVGAHAGVPELPQEVTESNIGKPIPGVRILDVVSAGSRFRIVSVRRDESREGTSITFEILFADEASRKYPRLDAYWIMDHSPEKQGGAPTILEDYAVERVKR